MRPSTGGTAIARLLGAVVCSFIAVSTTFAGTIYVKSNATGLNNGTTWGNAYTTLQAGIAAATLGDQVWVANTGTYKPGTIQSDTFQLKNGVAVLGGFAGAETSVTHRNPATNVTILSGDIDNDNLLDSGNSYHVVTSPSGVSAPAILSLPFVGNLDGFTVKWGYSQIDHGGGVRIESSSPLIRGCNITLNHSEYGGAGAVTTGSGGTAVFRNCTFYQNEALTYGGGVLIEATSAKVINCTFVENVAFGGGGVLYSYDDGTTLDVVNCTFLDNDGLRAGGALEVADSSDTAATCNVFNCLFARNFADLYGGAIFTDLEITLTNCTVADNHCDFVGGGMRDVSSTGSDITSCIFWGNTADFFADTIDGAPTITYSDVEDNGTSGTNIDADPEFEDDVNGDYHLQCGSPCIGFGSNAAIENDSLDANEDTLTDAIDLDLTTRIIETTVDMGAYEKIEQSTCYADINENCVIDVDDLLAVINAWGASNTPADVVPLCTNGTVDTDDLLAVINNWGPCPGSGCVDTTGVTMQDAEDCMDAATQIYEPFSEEWDNFVTKCVDGLRAAGLIE
jgi:predicted outer membrane repeat protein